MKRNAVIKRLSDLARRRAAASVPVPNPVESANGATATLEGTDQSRLWAEAIVEAIPASLLLLDADLRVIMANRSFFKTFRVSSSETIGRRVWELGDGQWNIARLRFLLESLASSVKEFKNFEVSRSFPSIGARTMLLNGSRVSQPDRGIEVILLSIEDVTEHKYVEEELRESEERFRQLAENIKVAFWMTDPRKERFIYISPGFEAIWGRTCESLYAAPAAWYDAIHPEDRDRILKAALTKQVRGRYKEEYRILRPDGSFRWIRDSAFPVRDQSGRVYRIAGIAEDITELKRVENLILEISGREQRRIGQDMHDGLCQTLTGIRFIAKGLEDKLVKMGVSNVDEAAEISRLVSTALTQADTTAKGLAPVELEENGYIAGLRQLATGANRLHGVMCAVNCDESIQIRDNFTAMHLYRIAQEALNNAVKHGKARNIDISMRKEDDRIALIIKDDGVGLPKVPKRNGMGLHIMKFRANKIGASLVFQRVSGGGTAVVCKFKMIERTVRFGRRRDDQISS